MVWTIKNKRDIFGLDNVSEISEIKTNSLINNEVLASSERYELIMQCLQMFSFQPS